MTPDEWNAAVRKLLAASNGAGLDDDEYTRRLDGLNDLWPELAKAVREFTALMEDGNAQS